MHDNSRFPLHEAPLPSIKDNCPCLIAKYHCEALIGLPSFIVEKRFWAISATRNIHLRMLINTVFKNIHIDGVPARIRVYVYCVSKCYIVIAPLMCERSASSTMYRHSPTTMTVEEKNQLHVDCFAFLKYWTIHEKRISWKIYCRGTSIRFFGGFFNIFSLRWNFTRRKIAFACKDHGLPKIICDIILWVFPCLMQHFSALSVIHSCSCCLHDKFKLKNRNKRIKWKDLCAHMWVEDIPKNKDLRE